MSELGWWLAGWLVDKKDLPVGTSCAVQRKMGHALWALTLYILRWGTGPEVH